MGACPGVGAKTAERLAHHLLKCPAEEALALAEAIREAKSRSGTARVCFHLTEAEYPLCAICRDPGAITGLICVVEQPRDLLALERAGTFTGVYHVLLGRLAPLQGMGPEQLTLDALDARVRSGSVREVILATNPTLEGDGTALLVASRLAESGVPIDPTGPRPAFRQRAGVRQQGDAGRCPYRPPTFLSGYPGRLF